MKLFKRLLIINLSLLIYTSHAQTFTLYGDKAFGTNVAETHAKLINAGNNQFILAGATSGEVNGDKTDSLCGSIPVGQDIWIVKIDTGFNIIWNHGLGGELTDQAPDLIMIGNNKEMIFSCRSFSDSACQKTEHNRYYPNTSGTSDYWICMLDSNGKVKWDKTIGSLAYDDNPKIIQLSNGDYFVCGTSDALVGGDKTAANYGGRDYWAVKLNSNGHKIWDKVYGGTGNEFAGAFALLPSENGGFIIAGTTQGPAGGLVSDTSRGARDIWIIKCDSAGSKIWDRRYGGSSSDYCQKIIDTPDGGFIVCGYTNSQQGLDVSQMTRGGEDVWVIKLDALGNKQWDRRYGGNQNDGGSWIENAPEGGYWVSGTTRSGISFEVSELPYSNSDYWILKIDSAGNKLWDKRFGGSAGSEGSNFVIMPDTSIYLFGMGNTGISPVKTDTGRGDMDYWVVHFKYGYTFTGSAELGAGSGALTIVPNPAKDICTITLNNTSTPQHSNTLTLYDITGRVILQQPFNAKANLDVSKLSKGVYIVEVRNRDGHSVKGKLVKE